MKKVLLTIIASTLVLTGCSSSSSKAVETVDASTWVKKVAAGNVQIIDVRTPEEYAASHIANAMNINVEGTTFDSEIASLDKTKTYALYCHSGRRSGIAADKMAKAGFEHVINPTVGLLDLLGAGAQLG